VRHAEREGERGAALLTVLLLVAVVAVIAGAALEKLRLATRLAGNAGQVEQARSFARAGEALALSRIDSLLAANPGRITLMGGWSGRPFGLPLPGGGQAVARVRDGGNCFNLNGLVMAVAPGVYQSDPLMRAQFSRLMRLVGAPAQVAEQVAAGAADWIDSDGDAQAQGAEDASYTRQSSPYRTAGTLMSDLSELRAVSGMTPELYQTLAPWLCALPMAEPARINVNTLTPEQAPLLAMLAPDTLSVEGARAALLRRPAQGYANADRFWADALPGGSGAAGASGVTSRWFALEVDVTGAGPPLHERALVDATRLPARLVWRQWGEE